MIRKERRAIKCSHFIKEVVVSQREGKRKRRRRVGGAEGKEQSLLGGGGNTVKSLKFVNISSYNSEDVETGVMGLDGKGLHCNRTLMVVVNIHISDKEKLLW